jgi:peptide/nickel transport system substrate-binding protein
MRTKWLLSVGCMALAAFAAPAAQTNKATDTLEVVWNNEAPTLDIYFTTVREVVVMSHLLWDRLVERDPVTLEHLPGLATAWRWVDPKTMEFDLRQGVKFHDGSDFDADDVVHTVNWAVDPANKVMYPRNVMWIDHAEKLDRYKVRLILKAPFPQALEFITGPLAIYPKSYAGPEKMGTHPIGTGPYRLASSEQTKAYLFERYDGYTPTPTKPKASIAKLHIRLVPDLATEIAELLGGRADWIWQITPDQADDLATQPNLQVASTESLRVGFISLDAAGRSGAGNPMTNVKVRQALNYAIDRDTLVKTLMRGASRPAYTPCTPRNFGCDEAAAVKYPYDPAKAKQLLAEAGFPNGLSMELFASTARPVEWPEAIQQYWNAAGINAHVNIMPPQAMIERMQRTGLQATYLDWGGFGVNDSSSSISNFFRGSQDDYARDPEVIKLLEDADTNPDQAARKTAYGKAIKRITELAYWVPINVFSTNYAATKELKFTAYIDENPHFYIYSWK